MCNLLSLLVNMQVQRSGCSLMTVVCQCTKCDSHELCQTAICRVSVHCG